MRLYNAPSDLRQTSVIDFNLISLQSLSKQRGSAALWALLGLVGLVALAWFCVARHVPLLEQRLAAGVTSAITPLHSGTVNVAMNGYQAQLSGAVANEETKLSIIDAASAVTGVRGVSDNLELIAAPVIAELDAPDSSAEDASALVQPEATEPEAPEPEAPEPEATVSDDVPEVPEPSVETPAEDQPEDPPAALATEQPELNITVSDRSLSVAGRVQNQRSLTPIIESVMTTFDLNYLSNDVTASDTIQSLDWQEPLVSIIPELENVTNPSIDLFQEQITLGGTVSSKNDEQSILNAVREALPNFAIVNRLQLNDTDEAADESNATPTDTEAVEISAEEGAESESDNTVAEAAERSRLVEDAEAAAAAERARLEAEEKAAAEAAEKERLEAEAAEKERLEAEAEAAEQARLEAEETAAAEAAEKERLEEERRAAEEEAARVSPEEQAAIDLSAEFAALSDTRILFQSGSDTLTDDSRNRLETIAEVLAKYPDVPVDIKGHTDSQGDDAINLSLSQLRANAVRDFLVSRGISAFRLSSFGYGSGLPITTNDTSEGRAANRRIEFSF